MTELQKYVSSNFKIITTDEAIKNKLSNDRAYSPWA
jgi:hypothetical protein